MVCLHRQLDLHRSGWSTCTGASFWTRMDGLPAPAPCVWSPCTGSFTTQAPHLAQEWEGHLHRWTPCTGVLPAQVDSLHRWSPYTGGLPAQVVPLHRWSPCTGGLPAQVVSLHRSLTEVIGMCSRTNYKRYGQTNDAHRNQPIIHMA